MITHKRDFTGPLQQLRIGKGFAKWIKSTRLLGITLNHKLSWATHLKDLQKTYASKLALVSRINFLPQEALEEFYTKVILPSVLYSQILWSSGGKTLLNNIERLHARVARVIYCQPWDTEVTKALTVVKCHLANIIETMYKRKLVFFIHKVEFKKNLPTKIKDMLTKRQTTHSLRTKETVTGNSKAENRIW